LENKKLKKRLRNKKMNNKCIASSLALAVVFGTTTFTTVAIGQQIIARMRFTWNFPDSGGAIYMNVCDNPDFNIDAQSGGCAEINVLNEVVTNNRSGTKLITDRLKKGTPYKACLVADNIHGKKGRWITCQNFTARDRLTISFSYSELISVRERP
jgi:hypothetical protein